MKRLIPPSVNAETNLLFKTRKDWVYKYVVPTNKILSLLFTIEFKIGKILLMTETHLLCSKNIFVL